MIETLPTNPRIVRARPVTFAYTRPLSPEDVSGITGRLAADTVEAPKQARSRAERMLNALKGLFARSR